MVFYFSGTGNSAHAARQIAEMTGDELISLNERIKNRIEEAVDSEKALVFVTPTYAWRIPRVVEAWMERTSFTGNQKAYFIMTCGGGIGAAGSYLKELCRKKGLQYMGCAPVVMPENYIAMFPTPSPSEAASMISRAESVIHGCGKMIQSGQPLTGAQGEKIKLTDKICSGVVNDVFYPLFVSARKFYTADTCIGCGLCAKLCVMNNITMEGKKPKWGKNCTHCMACISYCPQEAIEYGNKSRGKVRYHFPE